MNPMDNLTGRARSTMSLLLIASLIAIWAGTADNSAQLREDEEFKLISALLSYRNLSETVEEAQAASSPLVENAQQLKQQYGLGARTGQAAALVDLKAWRQRLQQASRQEGSLFRDPIDWMTLDDLLARKQAIYPQELAGATDLEFARGFANVTPAMVEQMRLARNYIVEIEDDYRSARAASDETVRQMIAHHQQSVRIPGFDLEFPAESAIALIGIGSVALMLYLLSVAATIDRLAPQAAPGEGLDWLFFHHSRVGHWLGALWIWLPCLVNLYFLVRAVGLRTSDITWPLALHAGLMLVLGAIAWLIGRQVKLTRVTIHERTTANTADVVEPATTEPRLAA